jgi:hypothetical protein
MGNTHEYTNIMDCLEMIYVLQWFSNDEAKCSTKS